MTGGLLPEQQARERIDAQLTLAGWVVQDRDETNLHAAQGVAVREVIMSDGGRADYLLYVDKRIVGVIEAKKTGTSLDEVHAQAMRYAAGLTSSQKLNAVLVKDRLPFVYEATDTEVFFTNHFEPEPRSRAIFNFQKSSTLASYIRDWQADPEAATWRAKVHQLPPTDDYDLRPASRRSVEGIEKSLCSNQHSRSLVQMATGAGKTRMAVTESYRLLKFGGFNRVLFLVDRNNLGKQTLAEFRNWSTPDDGRKFTDLYNVDMLKSGELADSSRVVISTIQRVWAGLKDDPISEDDDPGIDNYEPDTEVQAVYNPALPPEAFDLIIVDECHRSIYGLWRNVIEYFDAHVVGLTATPTKQTLGFFQRNLVSEYSFAESVADKVNVDFDIYRIKTDIGTLGGVIYKSEGFVPALDKRTREQKLLDLDDDIEYRPSELDVAVVVPSHIRTVLETFRDRLFTEIFPPECIDHEEHFAGKHEGMGCVRTQVPKTLIFAKNDNHAEDIVRTAREVFGKGNDFAVKITYSAAKPGDLIQKMRISPDLRIAVTVDMIATGTDIKPLECVFFMRDIRSATYFEQMKGRGARSIDDASFQQVTIGAKHKERFVIVDAVGVTEHPFNDTTVLDREKTVPLERLFEKAANGELTQDDASTLASRISRLGRRLSEKENDEITVIAGMPLEQISQQLIKTIDVDAIAEAQQSNPAQTPQQVLHDFIQQQAAPLASNVELRNRLLNSHRSHYIYRHESQATELLFAGGVVDTEKAQELVSSWSQYLEDNKDEITAIQLLYSRPRGARISFNEINDLIQTIRTPHPEWTPEAIWKAYAALQKTSKSMQNSTADLVSLIRYTLGVTDELEPFSEVVEHRYQNWLAQQAQQGVSFTEQQLWWLDNIKNAICTGISFDKDQLDMTPFTERGGSMGMAQSFPNAVQLLAEINQELSA